ncbi:hypothetical protein [Streptomyces sp. NPDC056468]|uniref:hypothetical protein n=1 Tax=Streptomyces sp. NPDC056468 TaxID=3345830 RepID=UPI0036A56A6E
MLLAEAPFSADPGHTTPVNEANCTSYDIDAGLQNPARPDNKATKIIRVHNEGAE